MLFFENDLDIFFDDDDFAEYAKVVSNNKTIKVLFDNQQTISDNNFTQVVIGYRPQIEVMNKYIAACGIVEDSEIVIRNRKYSVSSISDEGFGTSIITLQLI